MTDVFNKYVPRPVRFLHRHTCLDWQIKVYSISVKHVIASPVLVDHTLQLLPEWLGNASTYSLPNYKCGMLIVHEAIDCCFAIVGFWVDENMLQLYVYRSPYTIPFTFTLYSAQGMMSCVWELAILWHERNSWVRNVLMHHNCPQFEKYLNDTYNENV